MAGGKSKRQLLSGSIYRCHHWANDWRKVKEAATQWFHLQMSPLSQWLEESQRGSYSVVPFTDVTTEPMAGGKSKRQLLSGSIYRCHHWANGWRKVKEARNYNLVLSDIIVPFISHIMLLPCVAHIPSWTNLSNICQLHHRLTVYQSTAKFVKIVSASKHHSCTVVSKWSYSPLETTFAG